MNKLSILAVETSSRSGSIALADGPDLLAESAFTADQEHARDLLPVIDALLKAHHWTPASIQACCISIGPGSFTGLRVAVTFARHLALTVGAKLCAVPTLDVIAAGALRMDSPPQRLAVILDAKSRRVFGAIYERQANTDEGKSGADKRKSGSGAGHTGEYACATGSVLMEAGAFLAQCPLADAVMGEGVTYHEQAVRDSGIAVVDPSLWPPRAANVHRLGWRLIEAGDFTAPENLVPLYVRRPEAEEVWERKHAQSNNASNKLSP